MFQIDVDSRENREMRWKCKFLLTGSQYETVKFERDVIARSNLDVTQIFVVKQVLEGTNHTPRPRSIERHVSTTKKGF